MKLPSRTSKGSMLLTALVIFMLLFSFAFLFEGMNNSNQSIQPAAADISFHGSYKIGDGAWKTINEDEHISSTQGDVTLRGYFKMHDPFSGESIGPVPGGVSIILHFNHLGGTFYSPTGEIVEFDCENELFGDDACCIMNGWIITPETDEITPDSFTFVLKNPHKYGNENAIDDFLSKMRIDVGTSLNSTGGTDDPDRSIGLIILISALVILGIAVFSTFIHLKYITEMWLIGALFCFAGGYFYFNNSATAFLYDSFILKTRALGICMMFYLLFLSALIVSILKGRLKQVALIATVASGVSVAACIALSYLSSVKFYDTWGYWTIVEICVVLVLIFCLIMNFRGSTTVEKAFYVTGILALAAFPVDALATKTGWWEGGMLSKHVFLAVFMMVVIIVLRIIPESINSSVRAKRLEAEQQALKLELQESRISVMLSQMQPHFIFNTLNTIYHLCEIDPAVARKTISSFADYLRNNIDNLGQSELIPFEKELSFVKTYLDIEKVRFEDELEITFDISVTNFKLPVLTVQPIVENAVKHGTSKKQGVGKLFISTKETDLAYEIVITDTGNGFDPDNYENDGKRHVGIHSVRERLKNLCGGKLTIDSILGVGTTATITIPKSEKANKLSEQTKKGGLLN